MIKLGFIGVGKVGRVGGTLATLLARKERYQVVAVSDIDSDLARNFAQTIPGCRAYNSNQEVADVADFVFITTDDDHIALVCSQIQWHAGQGVVHVSGALLSDVLEPAKKLGAHVGVFHPNYPFSNPEYDLKNLKGTFDIEAEEPLLSTLKDMATSLDCSWVHLPASDRIVYYTAQCILCLYDLTLAKLSISLMQAINIPKDQAMSIMWPSLCRLFNSFETQGIDMKVTGPVARGNSGTIKKSINALQKVAPHLVPLYQELNLQTIPLALAQGTINEQQAEELRAVLKE